MGASTNNSSRSASVPDRVGKGFTAGGQFSEKQAGEPAVADLTAAPPTEVAITDTNGFEHRVEYVLGNETSGIPMVVFHVPTINRSAQVYAASDVLLFNNQGNRWVTPAVTISPDQMTKVTDLVRTQSSLYAGPVFTTQFEMQRDEARREFLLAQDNLIRARIAEAVVKLPSEAYEISFSRGPSDDGSPEYYLDHAIDVNGDPVGEPFDSPTFHGGTGDVFKGDWADDQGDDYLNVAKIRSWAALNAS